MRSRTRSAARSAHGSWGWAWLGGHFGYASVLPEDAAARHPDVTVTRVFARPDPATLRAFAEDARDGRFAVPVSERLPLGRAAEAQARMEAGGAGKIVLLAARAATTTMRQRDRRWR
ncbi:zinc-binding dehydrogenase [Sphingomonas sp. MMS24-JH45]